MRKQDQLQQLIQGLSANEKRYFKIFTSINGGSKQYLQLFDELAGSTQYNAPELETKTGKTKAALAHSKEHLKDVLLRALRSFNEDTFASGYYHRQLEEIELLHSKGQYAWAFTKIEKTLHEALAEDAFQHALQLLRWYHTIGFYVGKGSYMPAQIEQEKQVLACLANELEYTHLLYRFNFLLNEQKEMVAGKPGTELKRLMQSAMLSNPKKALSNSAAIMYHRINAMYHLYVTLNHRKGEKHFQHALNIFKRYPVLLRSKGRVYCLLASGLAGVYNSFAEYDKAAKVIDAFAHTLTTAKNFSRPNLAFGWNHLIITRLYNYCYGGHYKKAIEYAEHVQQQPTRFNFLTQPNLLDFQFITALCYWKTGALKQALKVSEHLIRTEADTNNITLVHNRFLFLLIQYDLANYTTLDYMVDNHVRWCRKQKLTGTQVTQFNKMLKELCKPADHRKQRTEILQRYRPVFANQQPNAEQRIFETLDLTEWMDEKVT